MSKNNVNALYNYTFWYWEYLRRNHEYIKDVELIKEEIAIFESSPISKGFMLPNVISGMLDLFDSRCMDPLGYQVDQAQRASEYWKNLLGEDAYATVERWSAVCVEFFFKYGFFWDYTEGPVSEILIDNIVNGFKYDFMAQENYFLLIAIRSYKDWSYKDEFGEEITFLMLYMNMIRFKIRLESKNEIYKSALEIVAIRCMQKGFRMILENQLNNKNDKFSDDELNAIYELVVSGRRLVRANDVRTVGIWLWDKVQEYGVDNVEKSFLKAHDELTKRFSAYVGTANRLINRTDARAIYETTDKCIKTKEVLHVAAKKSK